MVGFLSSRSKLNRDRWEHKYLEIVTHTGRPRLRAALDNGVRNPNSSVPIVTYFRHEMIPFYSNMLQAIQAVPTKQSE